MRAPTRFAPPRHRCSRRHWLTHVGAWSLATAGGLPASARAAPYPITAAAMRDAQVAEMGVYYRYTEFGRRAQQEGYRGIAYLFVAFAAAELVHAGNFGRIQARLNVEVAPVPRPEVKAGSTRDNLMVAADGEIRSVDEYYPKLLERVRPEGHADAMAAINFAWATEQRHRDKIRQVQRWSPTFFEQVAKAIDKKTGQYHVCQLCGCTLHLVPADACPVCKEPPRHYRHIEPPA
ncbi:rubrerythrin family protein [Ideonella sp. A 288]|uniref:rubrerythrin family protein n=1 Tax=Ideonella sp. A 288 TaxID=1962181 RepID=UPI00118697C6|nr:ferritin family protein [Ideonella sp. A 288]